MFNTIFYTFCTMILINLLAIPLAVFLDRNTKLKSVERAVFFFPSIVSGLLLGYIWGYILSPMKTGALNTLLAVFGAGPIGFTATEWGAKISIILVAVWTSTGWYATIYLAYLQAIPNEYYEAAAIDGASRWQQFTKISLPLLKPTTVYVLTISIYAGLAMFNESYMLWKGNNSPQNIGLTIVGYLYRQGIEKRAMGYACAVGLVLLIIVMVVNMIQLAATGTFKKEER